MKATGNTLDRWDRGGLEAKGECYRLEASILSSSKVFGASGRSGSGDGPHRQLLRAVASLLSLSANTLPGSGGTSPRIRLAAACPIS